MNFAGSPSAFVLIGLSLHTPLCSICSGNWDLRTLGRSVSVWCRLRPSSYLLLYESIPTQNIGFDLAAVGFSPRSRRLWVLALLAMARSIPSVCTLSILPEGSAPNLSLVLVPLTLCPAL